jgi:hypothetical protein
MVTVGAEAGDDMWGGEGNDDIDASAAVAAATAPR